MPRNLDETDEEAGDEAPLELPIDGTLDLHTFSPRELKDLIPDYIAACLEKGIFELRIIHGKGQGVLRRSVQSLLSREPRVLDFHLADESGGGWGATLVRLRRP
jgi:DNA-nicking Smr family endonuclease